MGPLANPRRIEAVDAPGPGCRGAGGTVQTGGVALNRPGNFYPPTVVTDVPAEARVMQEEPFGPLAIINRYSDLDAVIEQANGTPFALGAYAFTGSDATAERLATGLDAGMVGINSYSIVFTDSPIGGRRASGWGSEGGPEGIAAYMIPKFTSLA
jgi:succinate-semialdehyde dehydrogenase/glutarate-semialdehyde dehydrogenase